MTAERAECPAAGDHFIDRHREDLIHRITAVDSVADVLYRKDLLKMEERDHIRRPGEPEEKMIRLYRIIRDWNDWYKGEVYRSFYKHNPHIIDAFKMEEEESPLEEERRVTFIDDHRSDLTRGITDVDPVLCDLRDQKLLTQEQYDHVMGKPTSREKMRELCDVISHWEDAGKYEAYITLRKLNEELINDLEMYNRLRREAELPHIRDGGHFIDRHREDLIYGITTVDPVINDLRHEHLLEMQHLAYIRRPGEPEEKMRRLYEIIKNWDDRDKDEVYNSFYKHNPHIINDLKMQEEEERRVTFIDDHRSDLTRWITDVEPVLRDLREQKLLTQEQYDDVMGKPTSREKMRELCDVISHWEDAGKYKAYIALRKLNEELIKDLEMKDKMWREAEFPHHRERRVTFIDDHRSDLTRGITDVDPVLCDLRDQKLLTQEQYDHVMGKPTNREKMEELCDVIYHWEDAGKYKAYITLRKLNEELIKYLEMKDKMWREAELPHHRAGDHFIHRYREDRMYGITDVDPVVDDLCCEDLLKMDEEKQKPKEIMRHLYVNDLEMHEATSQESEMCMMGNTGVKEDDTSCKLCDQSQSSGQVITPTVTGSTYSLSITSPGLFRCSESGIQFQVTQPVTIEYEVDSWNNYTKILQNLRGGYEIIGPLFNIKSPLEPNVVSAVYLPHCLCLGGYKEDKSLIKCFHYKDDDFVLESPSRMEALYAVLENPTFSPIGVILYPLTLFMKNGKIKRFPFHGMVLLFYKTITRDDLTYKYRLHLYLQPNICSVEKKIELYETKDSFRKIRKPHQTESLVYFKKYRITGPQMAHVNPETLLFKINFPWEIPSFIEISINGEKNTEVNVSVLPEDEDITVWKAVVSAAEMLYLPSAMSRPTIQPEKPQDLSSAIQRLSLQEGACGPSQHHSKHFLDRHRADLTRLITVVDPVLDELLSQGLISDEQYNKVRKETTTEDQIRKLYDCIRSLRDVDKDKVIVALRDNNRKSRVWELP